ncbi:MAG: hypothetical protein H6629_11830 [Calditrichae bacterium]|nr:hypothetical protein [Calditrichia bacterium]
MASFYNYLDSLGYKNYGYLYRDDIEFTFPEIDISQASVNSEEIFGIENEKFNGMYDVVAQTFKPNKPMLSRIDIKIWRVSNSLENDIFSGDILYYITETKKYIAN